MLYICSSEEDATPAIARDEDLSTEEDDHPPPKPPSPEPPSPEPSPVVKHERPVRPAVQLKSAKEIELTESEEEEEQEQEEEQTVPRSVTTNKQRDMELLWGGGEKTKPKGKSGGLLLDWTKPDPEPEPTKPPKKKESPDLSEERSERRKKKSKKSSKRRENEAAAGSSGGTPTAATSDPFSSLDAWLNSDVSDHKNSHKLLAWLTLYLVIV